MNLRFTKHMEKVLKERKEIKVDWVYRCIEDPDYVDRTSEAEVRYWKQIPEFGYRFLRVVVNPRKGLVITAFFDRRFSREDKL